jgi:cellulose synthase/poly-beta-1,6-N-acetylglucosamine synthase-like glycosyltransferase
MSHSYPAVSVIMPILNEERHLQSSLMRVLNQQYPGQIEIVLALGPSKDNTNAIANELKKQHSNIVLVENPTGKTPTALNLAIKKSTNPIIVRLDGHALIEDNYIAKAVETLNEINADNVGGIMDAKGTTSFEKSVARAMTSKFGVGNAPFHVGGKPGEALTVYLGVFRREIFEKVGFFDETFIRAQDWEMNHRIRMNGGKIWFNPELKVTYRPRADLLSLAKQYFQYGQGRRHIVGTHKGTSSLRYLTPPLTVLGILLGSIFGLIGLWQGMDLFTFGFLAPLIYLAAVVLATVSNSKNLGFKSVLYLPTVFICMHICWGVGFLKPR